MGSAGGVGDAIGDPDVKGAIGDDDVVGDGDGDGGMGNGGSPPSHAADSSVQTQRNVETKNLRNRNAPGRRGCHEDTHSPDPW